MERIKNEVMERIKNEIMEGIKIRHRTDYLLYSESKL